MATPYTFTQPVRYYKSNDPYYYEVDNIPIRQLEENILYIKNKLEGGSGGNGGNGSGGNYLTDQSELDITMIKQLKPKAGGGRTINVNAGRFVSRVNDAFDIEKPLAELFYTAGIGRPQLPNVISSISYGANMFGLVNTVWVNFISGVSADSAYNINGLEFTHTFYTSIGGVGSHHQWQTNSSNNNNSALGGNFPIYSTMQTTVVGAKEAWPGPNTFGDLVNSQAANGGLGERGFVPNYQWNGAYWGATWVADNLPMVHLGFVQRWRSLFRTSVVDIPNLSIQVPAWSDDDFWYDDTFSGGSNDKVIITTATQRIDLLVAYSLPIDTTSTTLSNYESGFCTDPTSQTPTPQTITAPILGIVRGAGVGIGPLAANSLLTSENCGDPGIPGSQRILANKSDSETLANQGITDINGVKIHGSFPSPDDLLNIAPILALDVEGYAAEPNLELIGQAALPLAYIVVKKGQDDITSADIIDIRPFLRTTEFTYNERAGIAAANPPLSFGNPAVGAFQLQTVVDALQQQTAESGSGGGFTGVPLYTDYVMGGLAYGVEGTLLTMCDGTTQATGDPWGTQTTNTTVFKSLGNAADYDFSWATSSKAFMEQSNLAYKYALLEYFYRMRQGDLKKWLSNPNSSTGSNVTQGTYLGLAEGTNTRNIPLFPEWDMPIDGTTYDAVIGGGVNNPIPPATRWMWLESFNADRCMVYAPGGITYTTGHPGSASKNFLSTQVGLGWGTDADGDGIGGGSICCVQKNIDVVFPEWVGAYDVLAEYVNCSPVTAAVNSVSQGLTSNDYAGFYGAGAGLSVNKGSIGAGGVATFSITSTASPMPEGTDGLINSNGYIADLSGTQASNNDRDKGAPNLNNKQFQWLAYSVCLPQFRQTRFNCMYQSDGANKAVTRYTPKFGATFYPTVKFTIVAYNQDPISVNTAYNMGTNGNTLIQDISRGTISTLLNSDPVPLGGTAQINLNDIQAM